MSKVKKLNDYFYKQIEGAYRQLEGKLLTLVDATFSDTEQRKAQKDIIKQILWKSRYDDMNFHPTHWILVDLAKVIGDKEYVQDYEKYLEERPKGNFFKD